MPKASGVSRGRRPRKEAAGRLRLGHPERIRPTAVSKNRRSPSGAHDSDAGSCAQDLLLSGRKHRPHGGVVAAEGAHQSTKSPIQRDLDAYRPGGVGDPDRQPRQPSYLIPPLDPPSRTRYSRPQAKRKRNANGGGCRQSLPIPLASRSPSAHPPERLHRRWIADETARP